ncbi:TerB family tellurite resistance protein [Salaquimonas pukyongi]|uniref:tellurite resistance TerB family protein n=1 Tax=Salaquimonas pukyongi TaxID=2712698 RepID=UPI00096BBBEE|nr:TerB family tellurite resistance protein [Salaquimonas pukyongi]
MFDRIKALLLEQDGPEENPATPDEQHLAEAALMFHVIVADGNVRDVEIDRMRAVLTERYNLSEEAFSELLEAARQAESEAVDLYRFTSLLNKRFDRDQRIAMIERLWEMVFADGELHEFEDNVVWRVAQLLHVESPDRIAMKQRVRDRAAQDGGQQEGES